MHQKLLDLGRRLLAETDLNRLLQQAMDSAIEITGAERGMIILFGPERQILFETARHLTKEDIQNPKFEISRTLIARVRTTSEAICSGNVLTDPTLAQSKSAVRLKILSVICLPLVHEDKTFGLVYLDNRTVEGAFEPETCDFAKNFADFISFAAYAALERKTLVTRVQTLEQQLRERYDFEAIIGQHPTMLRLLQTVAQIADSEATVLIHGENGTGKELIARALHFNSVRKEKNFVALNCGAFQESLIESELFGHVAGAFTGAIKDKTGWFARADGGTIFLDEVSEMSPAMQVKLLRVLQSGEYAPVGSTKLQRCEVRVIAATNCHLPTLVREGKFREDLFYRLNVIDLEIPPLRERRSDIPLLIKHFLKKYSQRYKKDGIRLASETEALLLAHDYPGNVRELENLIERGPALAEGNFIEPRHLPASVYSEAATSNSPIPKTSTLTAAKQRAAEKAERNFIIDCLQTTHGHISQAAQIAGVDVSNFHKLMKKHGIDPNEFKNPK
ncbi:MAG: sigma-54-dependent Fis family transcriptional regulator [bacterium]